MSYVTQFLDEAKAILARMDVPTIERMVDELVATRERGGRLFVIGSGGGAGHASHAVNDFRKIAGIEAYSPSDNVSELTARINDDGWDTSYVNWLRVSRLGAQDSLLVFSVGGGSEEKGISLNLVNCMKLARSVGARILGVVGRDGGYAAKAGDAVLIVPSPGGDVTAQTEAMQAVVWHLLVSHPRVKVAEMKWESVQKSGV
jgi:D-sedoheptulose 7-phosphate isomerase